MREGMIVGFMAGGLAILILTAAIWLTGIPVFGRKPIRGTLDGGAGGGAGTVPVKGPGEGKGTGTGSGPAVEVPGLEGVEVPREVAADVQKLASISTGAEAPGPARAELERQRAELNRRLAQAGRAAAKAVVEQWASADKEGRMALARLLAQQQDPANQPVLVGLCGREEDPVVRRVLVQALGRLGPSEPLVLDMLGKEADPRVRSDLLAALGDLDERTTIAAVITVASAPSEDLNVRARAIAALTRCNDDGARRALELMGRSDPDWRVREKCVQAVAQGWPVGALAYLEKSWLAEQEPRVRVGLLYAAAKLATKEAEEFIRKAAESDADPQVRQRAVAILKDLSQAKGKSDRVLPK